jgi:hypothetical protein
MLASFLKAICIGGIGLIIVSCHDRAVPAGVKDYELKDDGLVATFRLPLAHNAEVTKQHLISFNVQYPSMKALPSNPSEIREDDIAVWIILESGAGRTENMMKRALPEFDTSKPGAIYYAGIAGENKVYKQGTPNTDKETQYSVFRAYDNEWVGIWQAPRRMSAERKLGDRLEVRYMYSIDLWPNHKEVDKAVTDYIAEHLITS